MGKTGKAADQAVENGFRYRRSCPGVGTSDHREADEARPAARRGRKTRPHRGDAARVRGARPSGRVRGVVTVC